MLYTAALRVPGGSQDVGL